MTVRRSLVVVAAAAAVVFTACGGGEEEGSGGQEQTVSVEAFDFYFDPTALSVEQNSEVTVSLSNAGENLHSFTIDDLDFEIEADGGEEASGTFTAPDSPGSVDFYCEYHPDEMTGTLSIGGSGDEVEEDTDEDGDDADVDVDVDQEDEDSGGTDTGTDY